MDDRKRYARGLGIRRAVLGAAHVDRATREATAFDREFQELITRYVWGEIWARPGLPRKTRRLLTLAFLVALDRGDELRLHVRAALRGGVSPDEIKEVLLQASIYCGVPAARGAFEAAAAEMAAASTYRSRLRRRGQKLVRKGRR